MISISGALAYVVKEYLPKVYSFPTVYAWALRKYRSDCHLFGGGLLDIMIFNHGI